MQLISSAVSGIIQKNSDPIYQHQTPWNLSKILLLASKKFLPQAATRTSTKWVAELQTNTLPRRITVSAVASMNTLYQLADRSVFNS
jgi:hypothetical protein